MVSCYEGRFLSRSRDKPKIRISKRLDFCGEKLRNIDGEVRYLRWARRADVTADNS